MKSRIAIFVLVILLGVAAGALTAGPSAAPPELERWIHELFARRSGELRTGVTSQTLSTFYAPDAVGALAHERGRATYLQAWAKARGIEIAGIEHQVAHIRVQRSFGDKVQVSLVSRTRIEYRHAGEAQTDWMGLGAWHWLQLVRSGESWKVQKEYYSDPLGDGLTITAPESYGKMDASPASGSRINRAGAAAYAEKYCGSAWGCGNDGNYNQRFRTYRMQGGDCANFASQVLTQGGGLKPDYTWRSSGNPAEGSACWVNAGAFARHLLYSGRARLLARGTFAQVRKAAPQLQAGDIVAYQQKGTITHVSVVSGRDSGGLPVVASHTADRFRNPWDLGWGKSTVFWLLQVR